MMAKHIVFLVHGMGSHFAEGETAETPWHVPVVKALDDAWRSFGSLRQYARTDWIEYVPITYDEVFREYLRGVGDDASRLRIYMAHDSTLQDVFKVLQGASAEEANFFWANLMDVLDYRYGGDHFRDVHVHICETIASKVAQVWRERPGDNCSFSVIAHSLGTAAAHGALNRLGGGNIGGSALFRLGGSFHVHAYISVANVSRVLWPDPTDIYRETIVRPGRPGAPGYVDTFLNVRHIADPIPAPLAFAPLDWGRAFQTLTVQHVRDVNLHDFVHYLRNPRVSSAIFRAVAGAMLVPQADIDAAIAGFPDVALTDAAKRQQLERLIADCGRSLNDVYGHDAGLVTSIPKLLALAVRTLWDDRQALRPLLEVA
jgi:hypothetical protein